MDLRGVSDYTVWFEGLRDVSDDSIRWDCEMSRNTVFDGFVIKRSSAAQRWRCLPTGLLIALKMFADLAVRLSCFGNLTVYGFSNFLVV